MVSYWHHQDHWWLERGADVDADQGGVGLDRVGEEPSPSCERGRSDSCDLNPRAARASCNSGGEGESGQE